MKHILPYNFSLNNKNYLIKWFDDNFSWLEVLGLSLIVVSFKKREARLQGDSILLNSHKEAIFYYIYIINKQT